MLGIVVLWVNSVSDIGNIRRLPPRQTGSVGRLLEISEFPAIDGASVNSLRRKAPDHPRGVLGPFSISDRIAHNVSCDNASRAAPVRWPFCIALEKR